MADHSSELRVCRNSVNVIFAASNFLFRDETRASFEASGRRRTTAEHRGTLRPLIGGLQQMLKLLLHHRIIGVSDHLLDLLLHQIGCVGLRWYPLEISW